MDLFQSGPWNVSLARFLITEVPLYTKCILETRFWFPLCIVPPPSVAVTAVPDRTLYNGETVTLTCTITLDQAVDTEVTVTASWHGPDGVIVTGVSNVTTDGVLHQSLLSLSSLGTSNSGDYSCTANVDPIDPSAPLIVPSEEGTDVHTITVGKGPIGLPLWAFISLVPRPWTRPQHLSLSIGTGRVPPRADSYWKQSVLGSV